MESSIIQLMTANEARQCVTEIKKGVSTIRRLLYELYQREGWKALGYPSWRQCALAEFDYGESQLYYLLDIARVELNISETSETSTVPANQLHPLVPLQPEEQQIVWQVVQETAPNGKITSGHVKSVVAVLKELNTTGAIDPGDGIEIPIEQATTTHLKAAITEETYERLKRQETYIAEKGELKNGNGMKPKLNQAGNLYEPQGYDACQTPPYALTPLLPYLDNNLHIWEPASGDGYLVGAFREGGYRVVESDLLRGQNFFDYEPDDYDVLITNPPYSIKYEWLERCYQLGKPFALLVPVETIGAKTAQELMQQYGFEMLLLDNRVDFKMPEKGWGGSAQFPVLWLCWQLLPEQVMFGSIQQGKQGWANSQKRHNGHLVTL